MKGVDSGGRAEQGVQAFRSAIATLADGGSLLVASAVPRRVHRQCCEQLLGSPSEPHRRVLGAVGSTGDDDPLDHLPEGAERAPDRLRVVRNDLPVRGATATDAGGVPSDPVEGPSDPGPGAAAEPDAPGTGAASGPTSGRGSPSESPTDGGSPELDWGLAADAAPARTVLSDADVGTFGAAINESIGDLEAEAGDDLGPTELRVCVDDLAPLIEREDAATVAQFVYLLGSRTRSAGGLFHAHLPLSPDDPQARTIAGFVDVVIRLRVRDDDPQMQWSLSDGPTSEWIPLSWLAPTADQP